MPTAIISALKRSSDGSLRAQEQLAGRSVLEWQVDIALKLGCERFICLCEAPPAEVIAQQQRVESVGLQFHAARGPLQCASLVREEDQLVIQLDGLVVASAVALDLLMPKGELQLGLWTLPASHSFAHIFPEDFERIDSARHWAGVAVVPGHCTSTLSELPSDSDTISLLLRLALQARAACHDLSSELLEDDQWFLAADHEILERRGREMMDASLSQASVAGPLNAISTAIVRKTATAWLTSGAEFSASGAIGLSAIGAALCGLGYAVPGLVVCGMGAFCAGLSASALQMRSTLSGQDAGALLGVGLSVGVKALAVIALTMAHTQSLDWLMRAGLPMLAIGLTWLTGLDRTSLYGGFWRDNAFHLLIFAVCTWAGYLQSAFLIVCLAALLQLAVRARGHKTVVLS